MRVLAHFSMIITFSLGRGATFPPGLETGPLGDSKISIDFIYRYPIIHEWMMEAMAKAMEPAKPGDRV